MRILTRYILHEVVSHAAIGAAIFTFVLFTKDLGRILELVVRNSAPLSSVLEVVFLILPVTLTITIPAGVLVGILIGLSRLAADSEITAMRASGIGVWSFLRMLAIFVVIAWLIALANGLYIAPHAQAALGRLQDRLKTAQASFEVQPRVFYEGFPKSVLYVQDVHGGQRAAVWKGVFLADMSTPGSPRVWQAEQGILVSEGPTTLHLHLVNGSTHEIDPKDPEHYQISSFQQTDIPIEVPAADNKQDVEPVPVSEMETSSLLAQSKAHPAAARWYQIELHRRLALPSACLVLALVGIPLGLSSKKGGKSSGFVLTIVLVFAYYSASLVGLSWARQGKVSPGLGLWLADLLFLVGGVFLLWRAERRPLEIAQWLSLRNPFRKAESENGNGTNGTTYAPTVFERLATRRRVSGVDFPTILDDYVLRDFFLYLTMIMAALMILMLVFTLFELLSDIQRNGVSWWVVGEYLINVSPYFLYNVVMQYGVLLAVLITFGLMERANEVTAIKATGISVYRIIVPVLVIASLLSASLFFLDQFYLPHANKRQDALRNMIKGKPAQTYLRPDRKWIFGEHSNIYYYQFFDTDRDQFADISVFQFDPKTFSITHRVVAERARWSDAAQRWIFEAGWERDLRGEAIENFRRFDVATFPAFTEPPSYFKKEVLQSQEMNYEELRRYIHDLQQSGFDVVRLRVQLHRKLAFPLVTIVMAVLAIPFSLSTGKRGAVTGVAVAVGIAVVYETTSRLFEAMGNLSQLPPGLAAWSPDLIFALVGAYLILKLPT
jgi:LPS export ABC transporter permease LptF/LPS export ABC transporter permease LptG